MGSTKQMCPMHLLHSAPIDINCNTESTTWIYEDYNFYIKDGSCFQLCFGFGYLGFRIDYNITRHCLCVLGNTDRSPRKSLNMSIGGRNGAISSFN